MSWVTTINACGFSFSLVTVWCQQDCEKTSWTEARHDSNKSKWIKIMLTTASYLGSITSRCSGKWARTHPPSSSLFGEDQRPNPGDGGNRAYQLPFVLQKLIITCQGWKTRRQYILVWFFSTNLVPNSCLFFVLYNFVIGPVHILLQGLPGSSYVTDCQLINNYTRNVLVV